MRRTACAVSLAVAALLAVDPGPGLSQTSEELQALRNDIEALRAGQAALGRELEEIKGLLRARAAPPATAPSNAVLNIKDHPFKGDRNARVTLVEFSDFQCPYCGRYVRDTLPQLEREYVATGKVKYVVRDFPLRSIHAQAFKAHEAARCAGEQGRYWEMHDRLFTNQRALDVPQLLEHAQAVNLDLPSLLQCLASDQEADKVRHDVAEGQAAGVRSTPTFFIGLTEPDEAPIKAREVIVGARPYAVFNEAIETLLSSPAPSTKGGRRGPPSPSSISPTNPNPK